MNNITERNRMNLGLVSPDVPLISNLDVWANIALVWQYHQNVQEDEAQRLAMDYLSRFNLKAIAHHRNATLTGVERFCVMLLRAVTVPDVVIVIDRPFLIMPDLKDPQFINNALKTVEDLFTQCYIFDFAWGQQRYRMNDVPQS
jgi:ABC-type lipopolysaccharide export system ATPase subunit